VRDEFGIRPLAMGVGAEGVIVFSSETCGLDIMGAKFLRDVENGEFVFVSKNGVESVFPFPRKQKRFCIFEYVYFARPDTILEGRSVYNTRKEIGKMLAKECPVEADVVVAVPDSGLPSALGYSSESGIPFEFGIIRSHYIGRTFIDPTQKVRANKVKMKHNPNRAVIEGKRVVLIDDSIVRGTTSKKIVDLLFEFGAKEVHFRVSSPPTKHPCFYGIDTPNEEDLIANQKSVEEIREYIGATSLAYISLEGLESVVRSQKPEEAFCNACFTKQYFV
jgi:amidophosphoribosyltransferase